MKIRVNNLTIKIILFYINSLKLALNKYKASSYKIISNKKLIIKQCKELSSYQLLTYSLNALINHYLILIFQFFIQIIIDIMS